jgi:hypothetical protein
MNEAAWRIRRGGFKPSIDHMCPSPTVEWRLLGP